MKTIVTLMVALLTVHCAFAEETKPKSAPKSSAIQLMELMKIEQTMEDTSRAVFAPFLQKLKAQGVPDAGIAEVKAASDTYFSQVATDPEFKQEMAALYAKEFTADELKNLIEFYKSPLGQKTLTMMPTLAQAGAKLGEKYAQKYAPAFQEQMARIMNKYKNK